MPEAAFRTQIMDKQLRRSSVSRPHRHRCRSTWIGFKQRGRKIGEQKNYFRDARMKGTKRQLSGQKLHKWILPSWPFSEGKESLVRHFLRIQERTTSKLLCSDPLSTVWNVTLQELMFRSQKRNKSEVRLLSRRYFSGFLNFRNFLVFSVLHCTILLFLNPNRNYPRTTRTQEKTHQSFSLSLLGYSLLYQIKSSPKTHPHFWKNFGQKRCISCAGNYGVTRTLRP